VILATDCDWVRLKCPFDSGVGGILRSDIKELVASPNMYFASPNMYFLYGSQGSIQFCNCATCAEIRGDWIVSALEFAMGNGY
jgi:hypothetical protein